VRRYFELMAERNPAHLELSSEDYVVHFPGGFDVEGRERLKKFQDDYFASFPDLTYFFSDFVAEGDKVAMRYGAKGTQQGTFGELPPSGKKMEATAIAIARIRDGKMVEAWIEQDYVGMMQQLGMELKPKEVRVNWVRRIIPDQSSKKNGWVRARRPSGAIIWARIYVSAFFRLHTGFSEADSARIVPRGPINSVL
jgi:predicted ester cyclase